MHLSRRVALSRALTPFPSAAEELAGLVPGLHAAVVSAVAHRSADALTAVRAVAAQYRMTNKPPPTKCPPPPRICDAVVPSPCPFFGFDFGDDGGSKGRVRRCCNC